MRENCWSGCRWVILFSVFPNQHILTLSLLQISADMDVMRCLNPGSLVESFGARVSERCRSWSTAAARSDSFLETIET